MALQKITASTGKINTPQEDEIARYLFEIDGVVHEYTYSIYLDISASFFITSGSILRL